MKNLFLFASFVTSMNVFGAWDCPHKVIESSKAVVVMPVYQARVDYQFDDENKKGTAYVSWGLNEDKSRDCFNKIEARYPELKASIGRIRVSSLSATVFKGEKSGELEISDVAGGYYMGNTDLIAVPYSAKNEVQKAVARKDDLINLIGDAYFEYSVMERAVVKELACLENTEANGVINLHKRLGEMIKLIAARPAEEKVSRDEALDQFMTSCVRFSDIEASSMADFEKASLRRTKLINGSIKLLGMKKVIKKQSAEAVIQQESTFLEF